jgi:hypothetical protein
MWIWSVTPVGVIAAAARAGVNNSPRAAAATARTEPSTGTERERICRKSFAFLEIWVPNETRASSPQPS